VIKDLGWRVGSEAEDLATRDSGYSGGTVDEQEAQRPHAHDSVAIGALGRARSVGDQIGVQLEAGREVVGEDGELLPGAVGAVVIGGNQVEGELPLELGEGLFLRAAAGSEVSQELRSEGEIGGHRRVFEVAVVW